MSETRGLHRATKVLQPPQRFPTAGGELRNSWLALNKNDAFYEGKTWAKGLTVFSKVGNSGGPTSLSPNISVHQTEKAKATYLPGRDEHERVGTVTALQHTRAGLWEEQHWTEPSTPPCSQPAGSQGLYCKFVHDIFGYFCPTAF